MRKGMSYLLIIALLISMFQYGFSSNFVYATEPREGVADEDSNIVATGTCGSELIYTISGEEDFYSLTISGNGAMDNYSYQSGNNAPWLEYDSSIYKLVIEEGVTTIGNYAFYHCDGICNATLPNSLTAIGEQAFTGCTGLSSLNIPAKVTAIGSHAFYKCTGLSKIVVPEGIVNFESGVFRESGVSQIELPEGLTSIGDIAFESCGNLKTITLPESMTSIGNAAFSYTSLASIYIPKNLTSIGDSNFYSSSLETIEVDEDNSEYKDIDGVLFSKDGSTLISFPYKKGGSAVSYNVPEEVTNIGSYVFHDGNSYTVGEHSWWGHPMYLKELRIPNVTKLETSALNCYITDLYLSNNTKYIKERAILKVSNIYIESCVAPVSHASAFSCTGTIHVPEKSSGYDVNPWISATIMRDLEGAHIWEDDYTIDKDATCEEDGSKSIHCEICDSGKEPVTIPATGHRWNNDYTIDKDATCVDTGTRSIHCTKCDATKNAEVIAALGHSWDDDYTVDKAASCTEEGSKSIHCSACDATKDVTAIDKIAHEYGEWVVDENPTCTEDGSKHKECACGDIVTEEIAALGHNWDEDYTVDKDATCTEEGSKSIHCSECDATKDTRTITAIGHEYESETSKATISANGSVVTKCSVCGNVKDTSTIYYPKTMKLSTTNYTYSGGTKTPTVSIIDANGNTVSSANYNVSYATGRKNVGRYKVTVTFKGDKYSGSTYTYFNINPKGTSISKVTGAKKAFTVKWKKQSSKMATSTITGYQIRYSTSSKMTSAKTKTVKGYKYTSKKITKLSAKKKYYVQVRTYKTVSGKTYYSSWSSVKSVKTK